MTLKWLPAISHYHRVTIISTVCVIEYRRLWSTDTFITV